MTDNNKQAEEELNETQPPVEEIPVEQEQADAECESLKSQLAEAQSKASEYKDGWLRSQAEFINYKNRLASDF